jgi:large conductance mechanosensitive channel
MSTSDMNEGDITLIKTRVTVDQTKVITDGKNVEEAIIKDISKVSKSALKSLEGFRTFILRGNVVDLAIGIVIGAAFTSIVTALVKDILTPLIPIPNSDSLSAAVVIIPWTHGKLSYGDFINAVISFLIVAAALYFFVVQPVNSLMKIYKPKEVETPPQTRDCPYCFQSVHTLATRCPYCTSSLMAIPEKPEDNEPVLILPASLEELSNKLADAVVRKATTQLEKAASAEGASE